MTSSPLFYTLVTRLKMAWHRVYARRRQATPSLVIHMDAGSSTNGLNGPESGASAWGGHIVDTALLYERGPDARATAYRRLLAEALRERDHARELACLLEQELALYHESTHLSLPQEDA